MNALWKIAIGCVILSGSAAGATDWSEFYDEETLRHWGVEMPPGLEGTLRDEIWPKLEPMEKRALAGVVLQFPPADPNHPMNFYAHSDDTRKTVTLPIGSLRFFGDITLAYAWLNKNGYSLDSVTDYLAMIECQWPDKLIGKNYRPLDALGIPKNVRADRDVMDTFQVTFGTAVMFIMGHELGHLYYRHPSYDAVSTATACRNEEQADAFALELMRRIGVAPLGMAVFFSTLAHLEPSAVDGRPRPQSTHPVTAERIRAIGKAIGENLKDYARTSDKPANMIERLRKTVADLNEIASGLADEGIQDLIRQKGLTAKVEALGPRRPGERTVLAPGTRANSLVPFDGPYLGEWIDATGVALRVDMMLRRKSDQVTGSYTVSDPGSSLSSSAGSVGVEGLVENDRLHYAWTWGTRGKGQGVLTSAPGTTELSGTWGTGDAEKGGGTLTLRRK